MENLSLFAKPSRPHHAAILADSPRLQKIKALLVERGQRGATTWEIMHLCDCTGVGRDIDELRKNGEQVECEYQGKNQNGRKVYVYRLLAF
jgi:hypothetical protein